MEFHERLKNGYDALVKEFPQLKEAQKRFYTKINHLLSQNAAIFIPHAYLGQEPITLSITNKHWRITVAEPHRPFLFAAIKRVEALDLESRIRFENLELENLAQTDFEAAFLSFCLNACEAPQRQALLVQTAQRLKPRGYLFVTLLESPQAELLATPVQELGLEKLGFGPLLPFEQVGPMTLLFCQKDA